MADDRPPATTMAKAPTGIAGLDEITLGGLPRERVSLVCGGPGTGKSLLALQFLVSGATELEEPAAYISFEESEDDLAKDTASLGWDLPGLAERGLLTIEHVELGSKLTESGDLEALFIRLGHAIAAVGAKRVALDSLDTLFAVLANKPTDVRIELQQLFFWLKKRGVTAVVTGERGGDTLTRHGLEEYISDCVILLDHRSHDEVSTRRLRVVKYRGSAHGTDEYPFTIDEQGFSVFPLTSVELTHTGSSERETSGVSRIDEMLGGGFFRASTVLVTGGTGSGKTSLAAAFLNDMCARGKRCLYIATEESASQVIRNMNSIGIELEPWVDGGMLSFLARRASESGLEAHLSAINKEVRGFEPDAVVIDPLSAFAGESLEVKSLFARLVDLLKLHGITAFLTGLSDPEDPEQHGISSLVDTWLMLSNYELAGERNRAIKVVKSRGTAHSNQTREFVLSDDGIDIVDAYAGEGGLLMGSARLEAQARVRVAAEERERALEDTRRKVLARRASVEAQIMALQAALEGELADVGADMLEEEQREAQLGEGRQARKATRA